MKLSRKLIPAFAMLLLSAVLMSTASFAWFSTNTSATVSGMNVKIATATTLLVKDADTPGAAYATSHTYSLQNTSMSPLSVDTPAADEDDAPTFFKLNAANGILPGSAAFTENSTFVEVEDTANYLTESILVRGTGEGANLGKLMLKIGTTGGTDTEINKSLRVMFAVKDSEAGTVDWFRCSPFGGTAIKPIKSIQDDGTVTDADLGETEDLNTEMMTEPGTEVLASVVPEREYTVTFYIWFEGQDATCFANNAVNLQNVGLTFTLALA